MRIVDHAAAVVTDTETLLLQLLLFNHGKAAVTRTGQVGYAGNVGASIARIGFWGFLIAMVVWYTRKADSN